MKASANAQGNVVTSVEPAAVGQHIPQNGQLHITDDTGRACAYGSAPNGKWEIMFMASSWIKNKNVTNFPKIYDFRRI